MELFSSFLRQSVNPLKYLRGLAFKKSLCFFSGFLSLFRFTFIETMYYIFLEWPSSVLLLLPPRLLPTRKGDTDRLSIHHLHHLIWRGMRRGRLWDYVTSHFVLFCLATRSLCVDGKRLSEGESPPRKFFCCKYWAMQEEESPSFRDARDDFEMICGEISLGDWASSVKVFKLCRKCFCSLHLCWVPFCAYNKLPEHFQRFWF